LYTTPFNSIQDQPVIDLHLTTMARDFQFYPRSTDRSYHEE